MAAPAIWFYATDNPEPSGGIRKIYESAETLARQGLPAMVVHGQRDFRPRWFESPVESTSARHIRPRAGDLVVLPELYGAAIPRVAPGIAKVVFNQNVYLADDQHFGDPEVVGMLVVSDHSRRFAELAYPNLAVRRIRLGVDASLFAGPRQGRSKRLAYMPRRRERDATLILRTLRRLGLLTGWEVVAIDAMTPAETAAVLADTAIFLSFSEREGFGLPPLEALLSGCIVVGYHGHGGAEFLTPRTGFPVAEDDITAYLETVVAVIEGYNRGPGSLGVPDAAVLEELRQRYRYDHQERDLAAAFEDFLERAALLQCPPPPRLRSAVPYGRRVRNDVLDRVKAAPARLRLISAAPHAGQAWRSQADGGRRA